MGGWVGVPCLITSLSPAPRAPGGPRFVSLLWGQQCLPHSQALMDCLFCPLQSPCVLALKC